eukprot:scaffold69567_cov19-Tisochrysis_lutea.AAC.2
MIALTVLRVLSSFPNARSLSHSLQLVCFDPDAPNPVQPVNRSFLHWVRANIPGHNVREGDVLCEYMGPAPPAGMHRALRRSRLVLNILAYHSLEGRFLLQRRYRGLESNVRRIMVSKSLGLDLQPVMQDQHNLAFSFSTMIQQNSQYNVTNQYHCWFLKDLTIFKNVHFGPLELW